MAGNVNDNNNNKHPHYQTLPSHRTILQTVGGDITNTTNRRHLLTWQEGVTSSDNGGQDNTVGYKWLQWLVTLGAAATQPSDPRQDNIDTTSASEAPSAAAGGWGKRKIFYKWKCQAAAACPRPVPADLTRGKTEEEAVSGEEWEEAESESWEPREKIWPLLVVVRLSQARWGRIAEIFFCSPNIFPLPRSHTHVWKVQYIPGSCRCMSLMLWLPQDLVYDTLNRAQFWSS